MSLPPPAENQTFCKVSALEGGVVSVPFGLFISGPDIDPGQIMSAPSLAFLLRSTGHPSKPFLFDWGIHKDWATLSPDLLAQMAHIPGAGMRVEQDVPASLRKGGLDPATDIAYACVSHVHIDHIGDPTAYARATYLLGARTRCVEDLPASHTQPFALALVKALPADRTRFLDPEGEGWAPIGPFPRALDFYGDGSLYVVDAPGHLPGHLNILARTSADGGWIYLAGDSAHHWSLIEGTSTMVQSPVCAHVDPEAAVEQIGRMRKLMENPRVRILLAHDVPWYEKNKGGDAFWPGVIASL